jgi:uncharacterized membrane protein YcaP (DUF421 family)
MSELLSPAIPAWDIIIRTTVVYVSLLILLRIAGKREIGQMTAFDIVVILTIANAVQNAMVGPDNSLVGGLIAAAVLVAINYVVAALGVRSRLFKSALRGHPTLLIDRGQFVMPNLRREEIDPDDVMMAMREHGIDSIDEVKLAVLETDGSISIVPREVETVHTRPQHHLKYLKKKV